MNSPDSKSSDYCFIALLILAFVHIERLNDEHGNFTCFDFIFENDIETHIIFLGKIINEN